MKREGKRSPTHHFSFGEPFDETLMKGYCNVCQCVRLEKPNKFAPFGQKELTLLATI